MNDPAIPIAKTCPRCGNTFECLHAAGCWCFDYTLTPAAAEKLRTEFNNCLCPDCLPIYSTKKTLHRNEN